MRNQLVFCLFGLFLAFGCAQKQLDASPPPASPKLHNPSDEECKIFAAALQKALANGDIPAYGHLVDYDALLERAIGDITDAPQSKKGFISGVKKDLTGNTGLASMINDMLKARGGTFRLLRVHEQDGQKRALYRLLPGTGGVNYYDFVLENNSSGKLRAVDLFVYTTGEMMSASLRQSFLLVAADESRTLFQRLAGAESEFAKNFDSIIRIKDAMLAKEHKKAWKLYAGLPHGLQKNKTILNWAMQIAQNVGVKEYLQVLETYKTNFPGDPCLELLLIDYYCARKEYEEAAACASRLDKKLGGDAHMKVTCAKMLLAQQKDKEAQKIVKQAVEIEDDFEFAYLILLQISMEKKDFNDCVQILNILNEKFGNQYRTMTKTPENAEFFESPQYREWKEKQEKK